MQMPRQMHTCRNSAILRRARHGVRRSCVELHLGARPAPSWEVCVRLLKLSHAPLAHLAPLLLEGRLLDRLFSRRGTIESLVLRDAAKADGVLAVDVLFDLRTEVSVRRPLGVSQHGERRGKAVAKPQRSRDRPADEHLRQIGSDGADDEEPEAANLPVAWSIERVSGPPRGQHLLARCVRLPEGRSSRSKLVRTRVHMTPMFKAGSTICLISAADGSDSTLFFAAASACLLLRAAISSMLSASAICGMAAAAALAAPRTARRLLE